MSKEEQEQLVKRFSDSDISAIMNRLGGSCLNVNQFTPLEDFIIREESSQYSKRQSRLD